MQSETEEPIRIQLTQDLTRYHPKLRVGEKGWTIPGEAISDWGELDGFVAVKFDNGLSWDLLWKGLEKIELKTNRIYNSRIKMIRG